MYDIFYGVAGPRHVLLARLQRRAHRVHGRHEEAILAHGVQGLFAHPGHHPHGQGHIGAVGDLDAQGADRRAHRTHAERHHIQGPPAHAAPEQVLQIRAHLFRVQPVIGRAGVPGILGTDEGAAFDPRHIGGVRDGVEAVRPLDRVQTLQGPGGHQAFGEHVPLGLRAVAPVNLVGLGQGGDLAHPGHQALMAYWRVIEAGNIGRRTRGAVLGLGGVHKGVL